MLALRVFGTKDDGRIAAFAGDVEVLGMRVFMPSSLLLIVTGRRPRAEWKLGLERAVHLHRPARLADLVRGRCRLPRPDRRGKIKTEIAVGRCDAAGTGAGRQRAPLLRIELVLLWIVVFMMVVKLGT